MGLWAGIGLGLVIALALSVVFALIISLFSLRVKTIYFAMITLAVAAAFQILCQQLSELTGISQATIFAIENGRVNLGVERAKVLAYALKCHPAVLVFPGWEVPLEPAA